MGDLSEDPIDILEDEFFVSTLAEPWNSLAFVDLQICSILFSFTPLPNIFDTFIFIYHLKMCKIFIFTNHYCDSIFGLNAK